MVGANLGNIWHSIPKRAVSWQKIFAFLAIITCGIGIFYFRWGSDRLLGIVFIELTVTFLAVAILLELKSRYFLVILVVGWYAALLLFFHSSHWIWELAEDYPVKPVAAKIQQNTLPEQVVYVLSPIYRPSLAFYSDRRLVMVSNEELKQRWIEKPIYALVPENNNGQSPLNLKDVRELDIVAQWKLITKNKDFRQTNSK